MKQIRQIYVLSSSLLLSSSADLSRGGGAELGGEPEGLHDGQVGFDHLHGRADDGRILEHVTSLSVQHAVDSAAGLLRRGCRARGAGGVCGGGVRWRKRGRGEVREECGLSKLFSNQVTSRFKKAEERKHDTDDRDREKA